MIDELLRSHLQTDSNISDLAEEIAVGQVPTDADGELRVDTYIWFSLFDENDHLDLDGESGLTEYRCDIEVCSIDAIKAKRLARFVKKRLQVHEGSFGSITVSGVDTPGSVQGVFVESKDDQYIPVNQFTNDSITVVALEVTIFADDAQDDQTGD